jgi:diguanylate cyclase (GGDEF)-like protein
MLTTYRARLIFYTILLAAFLTATLGYTYYYSRNAILEQADTNISNTARLLTGNIEMEENELLHYAEVIRDDPRIQEYMFMVTKVGADEEALANLFERNFGWLPVERFVFTSLKGDIKLGAEHPDLSHALLDHVKTSDNEIFYFQGSKGLELVAWVKLSYQGTPLGIVAVTHILNSGWLAQHRAYSGGHLFIEQNNTVQLSSLPKSEGKTFLPRNGSILMDNEMYSVRAIPLSGDGMNTPHLWHGISKQEVLDQLERQTQLVLVLAILGCIAILFMGLMIVRNFNRPLTQLMQITRAVTKGDIPMLDKSVETNEIDTLANRFSEMLQALREKQEEIDAAHKQLEESAITDALTGLYNRRYLKQVFPKLLAQSQRDGHRLSGLMLDLDYFKDINDRYGHLAGDHCLSHLASILKESSRASDYVFRVGGEEFLVLSLSDTPNGGELLAEKICSSVEQRPCTFKNTIISMTTSIGVGHCECNLPAESALTNLLFHADKALYSAKHDGRNRVVTYQSGESASPQAKNNIAG